MKQIRVLLVDDSPLALEMYSRLISTTSDIVVAGKMTEGVEVLNSINVVNPDVVSLDYYMPHMNGLEVTRKIIEMHPVPILIVSSRLDIKNSQEVFPLLEAGALDCIQKPTSADPNAEAGKWYLEKIRILSKVLVMKKKRFAPAVAAPQRIMPQEIKEYPGSYQVIVIGASTGGPTALLSVLQKLPKSFPTPVVCVQHISKGFLKGLVEWLQSQCLLKVKIAEDNEVLTPGTVYFPQEDTHLEITPQRELKYSYTMPIKGHRPSITVTMQTAARYLKNKTVGILLTGMGDDGAAGLLSIKNAGGLTIAQNEESSIVFGMPKEAIDLGAAKLVMNVAEIANYLKKVCEISK